VEPDVSLDDLRAAEPALANVLEEFADDGSGDIDPTVFKLDRNHEYSVWLSYAEIYNDKVYDLLVPMTPSKMQRGPHSAAEVVRKALTLKNSPPSDAWDSEFSSGKYADGLQHIRVRSAAEARTVLKLGQLHRRVVGTFANKESSRSHAVVSIKLLRVHRGERSNLSAVQTSRLTLVDLAGSERTKYTQTTGDRLKEAGYINRSLMVLGQCLETLRANQRKIGNSLTGGGRSDTRDTKKGLQVVPFRHNKMTELLMDYFVGDGRVVRPFSSAPVIQLN
jgi:kinesin family protein 20